MKIRPLSFFILIYCLTNALHAQHPEDFLGQVLGNEWLSQNQISEVEARIRWANQKGRLRGRHRTSYIYSESSTYLFLNTAGYKTTTVTDSSKTTCHSNEYNIDNCSTSIYHEGRLNRIENYYSTRYMKYDLDGKLIGIWCDNEANYDNGSDHVIVYEYNESGRLAKELELSLRCFKSGDFYEEFRSFPVRDMKEAVLHYSPEEKLVMVSMSKGNNADELELYRVLRYFYDEQGYPEKTSYFHVSNEQEILAFELTYIYR